MNDRTMRHVFKTCLEDEHEDCEGEFDGQLHHGLCICACHLAKAVRMFLSGDISRVDLRKAVERHD